MNCSSRIGIGYDIHRLAAGRKLVLGGVSIPFAKGLLGHSDSDVLTHAICDALLGAAALGDIGTHFPDTDPQLSGASSLELLARVVQMVNECGYAVANVDAVILAEQPKLNPYVQTMREQLACVLGISAACVSIKAKTGEGLEAVGRGEAIAAQAVALLDRIAKD
jgi:2-C-methyl-D-erythritol 2,4-cyclodiphosphate synthase